jgi:hypothetical protein
VLYLEFAHRDAVGDGRPVVSEGSPPIYAFVYRIEISYHLLVLVILAGLNAEGV